MPGRIKRRPAVASQLLQKVSPKETIDSVRKKGSTKSENSSNPSTPQINQDNFQGTAEKSGASTKKKVSRSDWITIKGLAIVDGYMAKKSIREGQVSTKNKRAQAKMALWGHHTNSVQNVIIDSVLGSIFRQSPEKIGEIQGYTKAQRIEPDGKGGKRPNFKQRLFDRANLKFPFCISPSMTNWNKKLLKPSQEGYPELLPTYLNQDSLLLLKEAHEHAKQMGVKLNQGMHPHEASNPLYESISRIFRPEDEDLLVGIGILTKHPTGALDFSQAAQQEGTVENKVYRLLLASSHDKSKKGEMLLAAERAVLHFVIALHATKNLNGILKDNWGNAWRAERQKYHPEIRGLYSLRHTDKTAMYVDVDSIPFQTNPSDYVEVTTKEGKPVHDFPSVILWEGRHEFEDPELVYRGGEITERPAIHKSKIAYWKQRTFNTEALKSFYQKGLSREQREQMLKERVEIKPSDSTKHGEEGIGLEMYANQAYQDGDLIVPFDGEWTPFGRIPGRAGLNEEYFMKAGKHGHVDSSGDAGRANSDFVIGPDGKPIREKTVSPEFNALSATAPASLEKETLEKLKHSDPGIELTGIYATEYIPEGSRIRFPYRWSINGVKKYLGF